MEKKKGMLVSVLRQSDDCTNNGLSSKKDRLILVGPGIPRIFEVEDDEPHLVLVKRELFGKTHFSAVPSDLVEKRKHSMFGGNFCYTSDSRFSEINGGHPIKIHDRVE